jgi:hypothetical protein
MRGGLSKLIVAASLLAAGAAGCSASADPSTGDEEDLTAATMPHVLCEDIDAFEGKSGGNHNMFEVAKGQVTWKWQNGVFTSPPNQLTFPVQAKRKGAVVTLSNTAQSFTLALDTKNVLRAPTFTPCPDDEDDCVNVPGHGFGVTTAEQDAATLNATGLKDLKMACMKL